MTQIRNKMLAAAVAVLVAFAALSSFAGPAFAEPTTIQMDKTYWVKAPNADYVDQNSSSDWWIYRFYVPKDSEVGVRVKCSASSDIVLAGVIDDYGLEYYTDDWYAQTPGTLCESAYLYKGYYYVFVATAYNPSQVGLKVYTAGWKHDSSGWWYQNRDGSFPVSKWQKIGGSWYRFNSSGYMLTGWVKLSGYWYYLTDTGAMATGWQKIAGKWYHFDSSGAMDKGWLYSGYEWYRLDGSGAMVTGWQKVGSKWYFFDDDGVMQTGWLKDGGNWYYLTDSGSMVKGWLDLNGREYYFSSTGEMYSNGTYTIGGVKYKFDKSGLLIS